MTQDATQDASTAHFTKPANYKGAARAAWICLAIGLVASLIPVLGWFVMGPMILVSLILGIVVLAKGGTGQGIAILLCALIVLPLLGFLIGSVLLVGTVAGM